MSRFLPTTPDQPAGPPPEVLEQIGVAWERARDLFDSDMELCFVIGERSRVHAELRDRDGALVDWLSASEALALACGDRVGALPLAA